MAISHTVDVPRENWQAYFNDISRQYTGWGVTIEVLAGALGDQPEAKELPFQGLSFEPPGSSMSGDVLVETGDAGFPYMVHHVDHPRAVRAASLQPGVETDIEIESEDGTRTVVRLRRRLELPPPPPGRQRTPPA